MTLLTWADNREKRELVGKRQRAKTEDERKMEKGKTKSAERRKRKQREVLEGRTWTLVQVASKATS